MSPCLPLGRVEVQPVLLYDFCEPADSVAMTVDSILDVSHELTLSGGTLGDGFAWVEDGLQLNGDIDATTIVVSSQPLFETLDPCRESGEVTLEVWATPRSESQGGPTRIVEIATDQDQSGGRDIAVMMNPDWPVPGYIGAVRTSEDNGGDGRQMDWLGTPFLRPNHLVLVHEAGSDRLYLDAEELISQDHPGDLSVWNPNYVLGIGNAPYYDVRNWAGTVHLVAVYCEALAPAEIQANYDAGHRPQ